MNDGVSARFFDGQSARPHDVEVRINREDGTLEVVGPGLPSVVVWPLARLRGLQAPSKAASFVVTVQSTEADMAGRDPARLILGDPGLIAEIKAEAPNLDRREVQAGGTRKLLLWAGAAVAAVLLMLFVILPRMADTLASILPVEREIAFGKTVTVQMERFLGGSGLGTLHCTNPNGRAALDQMVERITQGQDLTYDLTVTVYDHPMVNAFAAPGGQIVILRGLLDEGQSAESVAAVLAHEIGHVEHRDATRHSLRAAGSAGLLSMILGDFAGGAAFAFLGEALISATYTRDAEARADEFALGLLNAANVDSTGMAEFFDYVETQEEQMPDIPTYLRSHPISQERADLARSNAEGQTGTTPVLDASGWEALRSICD